MSYGDDVSAPHTAGHAGVHNTYCRIREGYWWPSLYQDTYDYVMSCTQCSHLRPPIQRTGLLQSIPTPAQPFDLIAIDLVGPFERTTKGNSYIAVCADYTTRWIEAAAIPDPSAPTTVQFLLDHIVARHGVPQALLTDRGTNFTSDLTVGVSKALGIKQRFASVRRPQTDGLVERFNKTLASMLAKYVNEEGTDWDVHLPLLMFAYRSTIQSSTGHTPFKLLYGREARQPLDVAVKGIDPTQIRHAQKREDYSDHVEELQWRLEDVRERARVMIDAAQKRQSTRYNRNRKGVNYEEGDLVRIENLSPRGSKLNRLRTRMLGPFKVIKQTGPVNYKVKHVVTGEELPVHADRMQKVITRQEV